MTRKQLKIRRNQQQRRKIVAVEMLENRQLMAADFGLTPGPLALAATESQPAAIYSQERTGDSFAANSDIATSATNATAIAYISNGYLHITGTDEADGRDNILVREVGNQEIELSVQKWNDNNQLLGSRTETFSRSRIPNGIRFHGYAGDDTFANRTSLPSFASGGDGNDVLSGGSAADSFYGDGGDDVVSGMGGGDFLNGGSGDDLVSGGSGNDVMFGGSGHDRMYGSNGTDTMRGGTGRDYMNGGLGDDSMYGDADADTMFGSLGSDYMRGGDGDDKMIGDSPYQNGSGGGDDRMYGDAGMDRLLGNSGNDYLDGGDGSDRLEGGVGHDRLYGRDGWDTLRGDEGNDYLDGGYDTRTDSLSGGEGSDTFVKHKSVSGSPGGGDWFADVSSIDRVITRWHW